MEVDARRTGARVLASAARAPRRLAAASRRRGPLGALCAAACLFGAAGAAVAQQPVVLGGGGAGGPAVVGGGRSGIVVNTEVLDTLGPGPAQALPYGPSGAIQAPGYGAPLVAPGAPGTAYRLPDTGQLVVTRPSTLLYPPLEFPRSRLTVAPPAGGMARRAAPAPAPEIAVADDQLKSRLTVPAPAPAPAPPIMPVTPEPMVAAEPTPAPAPAPMQPAEPAPMVAAKPAPAPIVPPSPAEPAPTRQRETTAPAQPALPPPPPPLARELQAGQTQAPPAEATARPQAAPAQSAALPPRGGFGETRLLFDEGSAELSEAAKAQLQDVVGQLTQDAQARVQLLAYAKDAGGGASRTRRLSLSRALAVRAFLIDQGIRSSRMDVRALGDKAEGGPADRVDILPQDANP